MFPPGQIRAGSANSSRTASSSSTTCCGRGSPRKTDRNSVEKRCPGNGGKLLKGGVRSDVNALDMDEEHSSTTLRWSLNCLRRRFSFWFKGMAFTAIFLPSCEAEQLGSIKKLSSQCSLACQCLEMALPHAQPTSYNPLCCGVIMGSSCTLFTSTHSQNNQMEQLEEKISQNSLKGSNCLISGLSVTHCKQKNLL